jgi:hypothetical protein
MRPERERPLPNRIHAEYDHSYTGESGAESFYCVLSADMVGVESVGDVEDVFGSVIMCFVKYSSVVNVS